MAGVSLVDRRLLSYGWNNQPKRVGIGLHAHFALKTASWQEALFNNL